MKNKIDTIEIETYVDKYYDTTVNIFIALGIILVILSPFIIDYFTK